MMYMAQRASSVQIKRNYSDATASREVLEMVLIHHRSEYSEVDIHAVDY